MKYMLVMITKPEESEGLSETEIKDIEKKHEQFRDKYEKSHQLLNGAGLKFRKDSVLLQKKDAELKATQLRVEDGDSEMTAYYVVECDTNEEVKSIAAELLDEHVIKVEIREIHHSNGM